MWGDLQGADVTASGLRRFVGWEAPVLDKLWTSMLHEMTSVGEGGSCPSSGTCEADRTTWPSLGAAETFTGRGRVRVWKRHWGARRATTFL